MVNQNLPLVNVIIANHNYGKWLEKSINSAISQDYQNKMITIVDDGSSDDSISIIEKLTKKIFTNSVIDTTIAGTRILAIKLDTATGPSNARNVAIENTKNFVDIYAILDADDEFLSGKITRCVAEMTQQSMIGVVYADYVIVNEEKNTKNIEYKQSFSREALMRECIVHSGALITKQALLDTMDDFGYYDSQMRTCEDYDLWIRISEKFMITHIPEPLTLVRVHSNNSTNTVDKSIWEQNWRRISQKIESRNKR